MRPVRIAPGARRWAAAAAALGRAGAAAMLAVACASCARDALHVELRAEKAQAGEVRRIDLHAQIRGPVEGLTYRWFSVSGECDPQQSSSPSTAFRFAEGSARDRVTVEVWRDERRVALAELDVEIDPAEAWLASAPLPPVQVDITTVPRYEPEGGPDTRADIAGIVTGELSPDLRVVIYARADLWYVQPLPQSFHSIRSDGTWESWTHTGSSYAVLVVRPGFVAVPRVDVLPQLGGLVIARMIVDGVRE
jgi:hypothetical protein